MRYLTLLLLLFLPLPTAAERPELPRNWLVTLTLRNPSELLDKTEDLLEELSLRSPQQEAFRKLDAQRLRLDNGRFLVGIAAPERDLEQLYPFAVVATPVEEVIGLLGGEMTGDVGVVSAGGFELAVRSIYGATVIVPVNRQKLLTTDQPPVAASAEQPPADDVTLTLSEAGLTVLEQRAVARRSSLSLRDRVALNELGWPPSPKWLDAAIGANASLTEELSAVFKQLSAGVSLDGNGAVSLSVRGQLRKHEQQQSGKPLAALLPELERPTIATLSGDATDGALVTLVRLSLAYSEGRPDEAELRAYPEEAYRQVADRVIAAFSQVEAADAALLARLPDDPFQSNRVAVLRVGDEASFVESLVESARAWNKLLEETKPGAKLTLAIDQHALVSEAPSATRFTTDVAASIESPPSEEVQRVMRRYYGPSGLHVLHAQPLGNGHVLLGDLAEEQLRWIAARLVETSPEPAKPLNGRWRVDRYATWQNAMLNDYMADAIGYAPRKDLAAAPVRFSLSLRDGVWRIELEASEETAVVLGRHFLKKPQPPLTP